MKYRPSEVVLEVHGKPPRCFADFKALPVLDAAGLENVFDELALFRIECKCGGSKFRIIGFPHPEAGLLCPHQLDCQSCGAVGRLFDIREHGYDAEFGNGCYSMVGSGESSAHICTCGGHAFGVIVGVSYQIEPVEDFGDEAVAHIQDFFDGYSLEARCAACGVNASVSSYECA